MASMKERNLADRKERLRNIDRKETLQLVNYKEGMHSFAKQRISAVAENLPLGISDGIDEGTKLG